MYVSIKAKKFSKTEIEKEIVRVCQSIQNPKTENTSCVLRLQKSEEPLCPNRSNIVLQNFGKQLAKSRQSSVPNLSVPKTPRIKVRRCSSLIDCAWEERNESRLSTTSHTTPAKHMSVTLLSTTLRNTSAYTLVSHTFFSTTLHTTHA